MKTAIKTAAILACAFAITGCNDGKKDSNVDSAGGGGDFEKSVAEYIQKFPYQDTYNYAKRYNDGDPAKFNTWILGKTPALVKAGDDKVVRMNNDTYYKMTFPLLDKGPVVLESSSASKERFSSFQMMDDHNVNFRNVINPSGKYTLYHGEKPADIEGEAIEVPSNLAAIIVRVEVKDLNDEKDVADAQKVFNGITVKGPTITEYPALDLLSGFDDKVEKEALKRIDETFENTNFIDMVAGSGYVPDKVSYLKFAAGTKGGWGAPVTSHSAYDTVFFDHEKKEMKGSNGTYTITTKEPPVEAFWSITVYDTERGGYLHPNAANRYHINNTGAVKNDDGTYTFLFKQKCEEGDVNCLEVPAGRFDYTVRYYLPAEAIQKGEWKMPKAILKKN